jgi:SAM-dependent methyltransferase
MSREVWTAVADRLGIGPDTAVLDVGCGSGRFCALAAARGAAVHGLDANQAEIERARSRVRVGEFRVGLMEDLPWPDDTFHAVTGFNAFQYALDVDLALSEARRVARPGAWIAICKWARPEDNEFFALLIALGARRPAGHDPMDDAIRRARLAVVASGDVPAPMEMPDDAALDAALVAAGALPPARPGVDRPTLRDTASAFRRPDGSYRFDNRLRYVIARA